KDQSPPARTSSTSSRSRSSWTGHAWNGLLRTGSPPNSARLPTTATLLLEQRPLAGLLGLSITGGLATQPGLSCRSTPLQSAVQAGRPLEVLRHVRSNWLARFGPNTD